MAKITTNLDKIDQQFLLYMRTGGKNFVSLSYLRKCKIPNINIDDLIEKLNLNGILEKYQNFHDLEDHPLAKDLIESGKITLPYFLKVSQV